MSTVRFIDFQTGQPIAGGSGPFQSGLFLDSLAVLSGEAKRRGDSLQAVATAALQRRADEAFQARGDAGGSTPPTALTQRMTQIWDTPYPPLDGMNIPHRAETQIGAEFTEYGRAAISGEMAHYRAGQPIPVISDSVSTELRSVAHFVSCIPFDIYQQNADAFSGMNRFSRMLMGARTVHMQGHNKIVFNGYDGTELYGLLRHTGIPRYFAFSDIFDDAVTGQTIVGEFCAYLQWVPANTRNVGSINTCLVASKIVARLKAKQYGTLAPGSVWKAILDNNPGITFIEDMHSLNDTDLGHGIFAFQAADPLAAYYDLVQPPTFLPPQFREFSNFVYVTHTEAGFKSWNSYNTILGFMAVAS